MKVSPPVLLSLLGVVSTVHACADDQTHTHGDSSHLQRRVTSPLTPPSNPLQWGDINIIHTTDSHGWLLGHQKTSSPEPNYSGDFGDFASFVKHMKDLAVKKDVDLLLVDSGDLHDGTGLSDGGPVGSVDAHDSNQFFSQLPYDILAIGNHELYIYNNTLDMYKNFVPKFRGRYLSSNVNITVPINGVPTSVPVGDRFAKFKTRKGKSVTAFGVLYDFTGNAANTTVQKVEAMVNETWFKAAIQDEPDLFLLAGHMPVRKDNWPYVFQAIRAVHETTPIIILGGHTHIRDCLQLDGRSMALESGRYMETVGWLSANLDKKGSTGNITFSRRYLDPNRVTYEYHSKVNDKKFDTPSGKSISRGLKQLAKTFDLAFQFGTAPHDFTLSRDPYPSNNSLLSLFIQDAVPVALAINNTRSSIPNIMITNSGSQRFDVYAGTFTKNDQLTASPFNDAFLFIPNVTFSIANKVLPALNHAGANGRRSVARREAELYERGWVGGRYESWLAEMSARGLEGRAQSNNLTIGYVTQDNCPGIGDDTPHTPFPYFSSPDFIASNAPNVTDDGLIDLVFVDFIEAQLLGILNGLQTIKNYTTADVHSYSPILANAALGLYAQKAWN